MKHVLENRKKMPHSSVHISTLDIPIFSLYTGRTNIFPFTTFHFRDISRYNRNVIFRYYTYIGCTLFYEFKQMWYQMYQAEYCLKHFKKCYQTIVIQGRKSKNSFICKKNWKFTIEKHSIRNLHISKNTKSILFFC